jgi:3-phenylpropionate/trans-cinnamate dioxygenase ferredoxin reductase subunit
VVLGPDIGDMKLQMVGLVGREDRHVVIGSREENKFSVFHFAGERLTAIETVNRPADHMLGRRILATAFSPNPEALKANPDGLKAAFSEWQANQPSTAVIEALTRQCKHETVAVRQ